MYLLRALLDRLAFQRSVVKNVYQQNLQGLPTFNICTLNGLITAISIKLIKTRLTCTRPPFSLSDHCTNKTDPENTRHRYNN